MKCVIDLGSVVTGPRATEDALLRPHHRSTAEHFVFYVTGGSRVKSGGRIHEKVRGLDPELGPGVGSSTWPKGEELHKI